MAKMEAQVDTLYLLAQPKGGTTKEAQNFQNTELYGSLTTKQLKKKHSSRPIGGVEMGSRGGED